LRNLVEELIPHTPKLGLYVAPHIPPGKLENAIGDYAPDVQIPEALALYDGTLMGSAKDGAIFCADRLVFQNTDLEQPQEIRYDDIVRVTTKKRLLGGRKVLLDVNRGRATVSVEMDFSARAEAGQYIARFLSEAMLKGVDFDLDAETRISERRSATDPGAVEDALSALEKDGKLTRKDMYRMLDALG
jgi:hypothetical protein